MTISEMASLMDFIELVRLDMIYLLHECEAGSTISADPAFEIRTGQATFVGLCSYL
jgi:hypothetical protein